MTSTTKSSQSPLFLIAAAFAVACLGLLGGKVLLAPVFMALVGLVAAASLLAAGTSTRLAPQRVTRSKVTGRRRR